MFSIGTLAEIGGYYLPRELKALSYEMWPMVITISLQGLSGPA